jgi:asparagine synthase (glutamine-hydrolysing)
MYSYKMCGIFGQIKKIESTLSKNKKQKNDIFQRAIQCQHRGPDCTKDLFLTYKDYDLYFVFHRLAINGLDEISNQPMTIDNITLLCNGEIYNYKQLAQEYNIQLQTNSDCEIILHLYSLMGIQCIELLDGVFTFLLFDGENGLVYVGHDPIGIRSGYMIQNKEELIVASEMKSLVEYGDRKIEMIQPGSYTEYNLNTGNYYTNKYFHLEFPIKYTEDDKSISMIQSILYKSVKKRLMSDQPIGCLLSGGIDSSIICSLVNEIGRESNPSYKVNTFSIGLENSPDILYAEKVALYLGANHTTYIVTEKEMLEAIEPTIKQIESYDTTTVRASVPMYLLSKKISENTDIKVILSGEGADELSGSYLYFHNVPSPLEFQRECIRLISDVQHFDVLRGDKTTAGHGLEIRVPFFDKEFVKEYMSIEPKLKVVRNNFEKYLLRKSFETKLPEEVVWRRKDGFSDGVSENKRPWYQIINDYTHNKYYIKEDEYYQCVFKKYYGGREYIVPYQWLPKWTDQMNPSNRLILS